MSDLTDKLRAANWETDDLHEMLEEAADELDRIQSIVSCLEDYDHHGLQAMFDEEDGAVDSRYYADSEDESRLAQEGLDAAILLLRGADSATRNESDESHRKTYRSMQAAEKARGTDG